MISFDCCLTRGAFAFDVAFDSDAGITGLFGPSGSGKTTIIHLVAGLVVPQRGRIEVGDVVLTDTKRGVMLPPHKRGVGLVFQDAHLFPHMSVRRNLAYGRSFNQPSGREVGFDAVVEVLGIGHLLDRSPQTLSGGERQRVAIGRALLASPRILLLDEPLAALDTSRKLEILPFIERLRDEFAIPMLYVSHSVEEIARLAARVVKIDNGRTVALGSTASVLTPETVSGAHERFDTVSTITATFTRYDPEFGITVLAHSAGTVIVPGRIEAAGSPVRLSIRATNVSIAVERPQRVSIRTILSGRIAGIESYGPLALVAIDLDQGQSIAAYVTRLALSELALTAGDNVYALVKSVAIDEVGVSGMQKRDDGEQIPKEI